MPVHNAEKWLDESINSVLAQNYDGPMEISFYNDASTDGSFVKILTVFHLRCNSHPASMQK